MVHRIRNVINTYSRAVVDFGFEGGGRCEIDSWIVRSSFDGLPFVANSSCIDLSADSSAELSSLSSIDGDGSGESGRDMLSQGRIAGVSPPVLESRLI